jgi:predicted secreted protein
MAIVNIASVDIDLSVNGSLIGCAQSMSLEEAVETTSAACRASGKWKESVSGVNSFSASLDGLVRVTSGTDIPLNTTYKELTDLKDAGVPVTIAFGPALKGAYRRVGNALITGVNTTAGDTGFATFSLSLEGTGPLAWVQNP